MYNFNIKQMNDGITLHQVLIRFQNPDNCRGNYVTRLADFTNYDGLVATNNPIDAIIVDIRSYCFDHVLVREDIYRFTESVSFALGVRCNSAFDSVIHSSNDVVGGMAQEPIREVTYVIEILK